MDARTIPAASGAARIGLLLAAVALAAACAGQPAASPSPAVADATDAAPTSRPGPRSVALDTATGNAVTIDIEDASHTLIAAVSGTPGAGASTEPYTVSVTNDDPTVLRLTWVGGPCDARDMLTIDAAARQFVVVQPECPGDAVVSDRILIVGFSEPIDAADVHATLQDGLDTSGG